MNHDLTPTIPVAIRAVIAATGHRTPAAALLAIAVALFAIHHLTTKKETNP